MFEGKSGILKNTLRKIRVKLLNRNIIVFTFFLMLSFIFWYLNSLRKEIEVDLKYPVKYINQPSGRQLSGELPDKLTLNLAGHGYSIVKLRLSGNRSPLLVDFSKVRYRKISRGNSEYYLTTAGLVQGFAKQLQSEFQIISLKPDTLFFRLVPVPVQQTNKSRK
ncbi:MAG: hypothetical protein U0X39_14265 [Bacteroidales bacterium]